MSTITINEIATNRYAPAGSNGINLYSTEAAENLTIGQLVQAACLTAAAAYENQSVLKMNSMTAGSTTLQQAAAWLSSIADGSAVWEDAKAFLTTTMGIDESVLPQDLSSYDRRMQAANALKSKMEGLVQNQQTAMVDLQTLVNRRDVAHSTSANVVRALATASLADAANFS